MNWEFVATASVLALLTLLAWRRLTANGYAPTMAMLLVACFVAQLARCFGSRGSLVASMIGLDIYAVNACAFLLARQKNVRRIIRTGGALACAQAVIPFGFLFTMTLVPVLIGVPRTPDGWRKSFGILLLLAFLPVVAAILMVTARIHVPIPAAHHVSPNQFAAGLAMLIAFPLLTSLGFRGANWARFMPLLMGEALLIAVTAASFFGARYGVRALAPALASILLIAISEWPSTEHRDRNALGLLVGAAALSWIGGDL